MRWNMFCLMIALMLGSLPQQATAQYTYERKSFGKIESTNSVEYNQNAQLQSVIMRLDTAVVLADSGDTWISSDILLQNMLWGYPTRANLIVDLTAGSFSVFWRENYGLGKGDTVHFQNVQAPDSGQVIIEGTSPWSTSGAWRWFADFGGGSDFYFVVTAHSDSTKIREIGVQLMP